MKTKSNKSFTWFILFICFIIGLVAFYLGTKDGEEDKQSVKEGKSGLVIESVNYGRLN